ITGAIADAINYAIEALRDLVLTINDTAVQLDSAARQTQAAAGHLAKASVAQSRQVAAATDAVGAMATSIEEVSSNS
ncbi:MAG TPA: chemotaxis protein, partial [Steroidobacteraceae bacterium]|nr:chemotaxis protein [Steroidobacteraceae bacterium]